MDAKSGKIEVDSKSGSGFADSNDETLEARYRALEVEKRKIEHELEFLKKENTELKERISNLENERNESHEKKNTNEQNFVDLTEPNEVDELVMEITALQFEKENAEIEKKKAEIVKEKAEKDAAMWKQKCEELLSKMDDKGRHEHEGVSLMVDLSSFSGPADDRTPNLQNAGTPPSYELKQKYKDEAANQSRSNRRAKKQLLFEDKNKGIAPQTPSVSKRAGIIDISDSDDDLGQGRRARASEPDEKDGDEEMNISFTPTNKRKRGSRVVNSDTESDDDDDYDYDDDAPISTLKKSRRSEKSVEDSETPVRRRIRPLREAGETSRGIPTTKDSDSDDSQSEDVGLESESEGESLGGFIVHDDADVEGENDGSVSKEETEEEEEDGDVVKNYEDAMSLCRRNKHCEWNWKSQGEMQAAFGKDSLLCMKAVCALYRQQTADEKVSKEAIYLNGFGFSKFDALTGCRLGEFLTGGNPDGKLAVSVEQLRQYDAKGEDLCEKLAIHYAKQLFNIFQGGKDPFFRRSENADGV